MTPKTAISIIIKQYSLSIIFLVGIILAYPHFSLASSPFSLIDSQGKKNKVKQPTIQQKQAGKGLGSIQWSDKSGGLGCSYS